jgi:hypothetical protein
MRQFHDRTSWQRHISDCVPEYVGSLDSKDSIQRPHLLCTVVLHSESDLCLKMQMLELEGAQTGRLIDTPYGNTFIITLLQTPDARD